MTPIPDRQRLLYAAARLELGDCADVAQYLREQAAGKFAVTWVYLGGYTNCLWASDPGRPAPLPFRNPPGFAFYVADLLSLPGHPIDVSGPLRTGEQVVRANIHQERKRLAKRLSDRQQIVLAKALIDDIHLEQDGDRVLAEYAPIDLPLLLKD